MAKSTRTLWIGAGLVVLGSLSLWAWQITRDLPSAEDGDLLLARAIDLAPERNAHVGLALALAAARELDAIREPLPEPLQWDRERIQSEGGEAVYGLLDAALLRPALQFPPPGEEDPATPSFLELSYLLDARSRVHAENGVLDRAAADALVMVVLGERLATGESVTLVPAVVGARIQELGFARLRTLLEVPGVDAGKVSGWLARLGDRPIPEDARRRIWAGEYESFKTQFIAGMNEHRAGVPFFMRSTHDGYFFQQNRTMAKIADSFRRFRDAEASCGRGLGEAPDEMRAIDYVRPNAVGEILARVASPAYERYFEQFCALEVRRQSTRSVLALRIFQLENGEYPERLEALVPSYLPTLPTDPFSDGALRYSRDSMRVWSIGRDRIDRGGNPPADPSTLDEISTPVRAEIDVAQLEQAERR